MRLSVLATARVNLVFGVGADVERPRPSERLRIACGKSSENRCDDCQRGHGVNDRCLELDPDDVARLLSVNVMGAVNSVARATGND